jgi:hypothetical protein
MAHVEKRSRSRRDGSRGTVFWRARYRGPDGRERSQTFPTKAAAQRWLTTVETSKMRDEWIDPKIGKTSCSDYIDGWLATKADVAASTKLNIEGRVKKHIRPFFEDMPVNAVRPAHARAFVAGLVASALAPATVKSITLTASQVFAQAVDDNLIARSPFARVALPAQRQHEEMRFLTPEQVNRLAGATDSRYRAAIYLAAYGGLRAGELWALRVDRLNILAATVEVVASMSEAGGLHTGPPRPANVAPSRCHASCHRCSASTSAATRHPTVGSSRRPRAAPSIITTFVVASTRRPSSRPSCSACASTICATRVRRCSSPRAGTSRR